MYHLDLHLHNLPHLGLNPPHCTTCYSHVVSIEYPAGEEGGVSLLDCLEGRNVGVKVWRPVLLLLLLTEMRGAAVSVRVEEPEEKEGSPGPPDCHQSSGLLRHPDLYTD